MPYLFLQPLCLIGIIDVMRHYVKAFFLIFSFLFCLFAFRLFIFVKNDIIILIFNPLPLFSRKRGPFMNRKQKLGNVLIISSRKRMLSEFQSYLHSVLGEYLTFNTLLREQATDPSLFRGYQCVLFPSVRAMETFPLTLDSSILRPTPSKDTRFPANPESCFRSSQYRHHNFPHQGIAESLH